MNLRFGFYIPFNSFYTNLRITTCRLSGLMTLIVLLYFLICPFQVQAALTASSFFFLAFPPFGSLLLPRIRHLATDPSFSLDQRLTATWQLSLMTQSSSLSLAAFTVQLLYLCALVPFCLVKWNLN